MEVDARAVARAFALERHGDQRYGDEPYGVHLAEVAAVLARFAVEDPDLAIAAWLHDVVEDTDATLDDVDERFGSRIRALVDAVTMEAGDTRAARNAATHPKIRATPGAVTLKLCDRIANVERGGPKRALYRSEHEAFRAALHRPGEADAMWAHLDRAVLEP